MLPRPATAATTASRIRKTKELNEQIPAERDKVEGEEKVEGQAYVNVTLPVEMENVSFG